jgi:hypothetical protein
VYVGAVKRLFIGILLVIFCSTVPIATASAAAHPPLTLAQGRQLIQQYSQRTVTASGGGYATIGRCARLTAWKIECVSSLTAISQSHCVMIVTVWNTGVSGGYYSRRYSHRGLACVPAPTAPAPTPVVPVIPPVVSPTSIPAALARSVADAYVGGIMRNAYSTVGGVSYCNYPLGYSDTCSYSFSGNRIADGSFYQCNGSLTINGSYSDATGWQTTVDYGAGPQCY